MHFDKSDPNRCLTFISNLIETQNLNSAFDYSEEAFKIFPENHKIKLMHIDVLIELKKFDEAKMLLEKACKSEPDRMVYLIKNAYLNACTENKEACLKWISKAKSLEPNNMEIHFWKALSYYKLGLNDKALDELIKIRVDSIKNKRKLYNIAELYQKLKKKYDSLKILSSILEIDPLDHNCMYTMAKIYFENSEYSFAQDLLIKACTLNKEIHEYHHLLGLVYSKFENSEKALRHISTALYLNPSNSEYNYFMGIEYIKKKLYFHSKTFLERAIELTPSQPQYHEAFAISLMYCGDDEKSEQEFKKALKLNPVNPVTLRNLGLLYQKIKKYKKAYECYLKALEINPDFHEALARLITVSEKCSLKIPNKFNLDEARDSLFNSSVSMLKKNKFQEAFEQLNLVLEIDPDFAEAHYILGETLCSHNCLKTAIFHLETAVSLDDDEYYIIALYDALKKAGKNKKADKTLEKLSNVYFREALDLVEEGCHEDAVIRFKKSLELNSDNIPSMYNLALLKQMQNQNHEALKIYYSCLEKTSCVTNKKLCLQIKNRINEINIILNQIPQLVNEHTKNSIKIQIKSGLLHQCNSEAIVIPVSASLFLRKSPSRNFKEFYPDIMEKISPHRPLKPGTIFSMNNNGQLLIFASISFDNELTSKAILTNVYKNIFLLINKKKISHISMPPLGTNMKWFNLDKSSENFAESIKNNQDSLNIDLILKDNGICKEMSAQLIKYL